MSNDYKSRFVVGENKLILPCSIFLMIIFLIYNVSTLSIFLITGLMFAVVAVLLFNYKDAFLLLTFLTPNLMMIKRFGSATAYVGYLFLILEIKYIFESCVKKRNLSLPVSLLFLTINCILTSVLYSEFALLPTLGRNFLFFIFVFNFFQYYREDSEFLKNIIEFYIFGCATSVILGIVYCGVDTFNGYFGGVRNDRNFFGSVMISGISLSILYLNKCRLNYKVIISFIFMLLGGLLSNSRTFIISFLFCSVLFLWFGRKQNLRVFFIIVCLCVILYIMFRSQFNYVVSNIIDRFKSDDVKSGNNRFDLWKFYIEYSLSSLKSFIFGNGQAIKFVKSKQIKYVEHNSFIEGIFTYGYPTFVLVIAFFVSFFKSQKFKNLQFIDFIPIMAISLSYFTVSGFMSDNLNMAYVISIIAINIKDKNNGREFNDVCVTNKCYVRRW